MGEKPELGTVAELSGSFKDPLESHDNDCKWHEWAFVYIFLPLSSITWVQAHWKWRLKFIQGWVWPGDHDGGREGKD